MADDLLSAIEAFLCEARRARKSADLTHRELRLRKQVRGIFHRQRSVFLQRFAHLKSHFAEAISDADWAAAWAAAQAASDPEFTDALQAAYEEALQVGAEASIADLGVDIAFDLKNPRAVAFLERRAAEMVTGINDTTRDRLRRTLAAAVDSGKSYGETARAIETLFTEFESTRAETIAVHELGTAYIEGNMIVGRDLQDAGLEMTKAWLGSGQSCEEICQPNEDDGDIPFDDAFSSGDDQPPGHVHCDCDITMDVVTPETANA
jgi:hypothetical protein